LEFAICLDRPARTQISYFCALVWRRLGCVEESKSANNDEPKADIESHVIDRVPGTGHVLPHLSEYAPRPASVSVSPVSTRQSLPPRYSVHGILELGTVDAVPTVATPPTVPADEIDIIPSQRDDAMILVTPYSSADVQIPGPVHMEEVAPSRQRRRSSRIRETAVRSSLVSSSIHPRPSIHEQPFASDSYADQLFHARVQSDEITQGTSDPPPYRTLSPASHNDPAILVETHAIQEEGVTEPTPSHHEPAPEIVSSPATSTLQLQNSPPPSYTLELERYH